jgi:hypothetical protein
LSAVEVIHSCLNAVALETDTKINVFDFFWEEIETSSEAGMHQQILVKARGAKNLAV